MKLKSVKLFDLKFSINGLFNPEEAVNNNIKIINDNNTDKGINFSSYLNKSPFKRLNSKIISKQ